MVTAHSVVILLGVLATVPVVHNNYSAVSDGDRAIRGGFTSCTAVNSTHGPQKCIGAAFVDDSAFSGTISSCTTVNSLHGSQLLRCCIC